MKLGTCKEDGMNVTYFEDGLVVSMMPSPFLTELQMEKFENLPNGHKYPEPDLSSMFKDSKWVMMDFSTDPVTITEL